VCIFSQKNGIIIDIYLFFHTSMTFYWPSLIAYISMGYVLGSIPFGLIWTKVFKKGDPRLVGSCNIGATNVYRMAGFKIAALVYVSDFLKSALPVLFVPTEYKIPTGIACIVGHIFSLFLKFKGGKGVAAACGVMVVVMPIAFGASLALWYLIFKTTGYVSLASLVGVFSALIFSAVFFDAQHIMGMGLISALIVYSHRSNISRLLQGKESAITPNKP